MRRGLFLGLAIGMFGCPGDDGQDCDTDDCGGSSGSDTGDVATTMAMTTAMTADPTTQGSETGDPDPTGDPTDSTVGDTAADDTAGGCDNDGQCSDDTAPFCVAGVCSPCSATDDPQLACQGLDPMAPLCVDDSCVSCADQPGECGGATPVCDSPTGECLPCTDHAQCPDSACHAFEGSCLDPAIVLYVNQAAADGGDGSAEAPFRTINEAVDVIPANGEGTILVDQGGMSYSDSVAIDSGKVVALLALGGGLPELRSIQIAPAFEVTDATGYLDGFRVRGNDLDDSTRVTDGALDIRRSLIVLNDGGNGIDGTNSQVRVEATQIYLHDQSGILMQGSDLQLINTKVAANGGFNDPTSALFLEDTTFSILYSTVTNNFGGGGQGGPVEATLECRGDSDGVIRNSIMLAPEPNQIDNAQCPTLEVINSAVDTADLDGSGSMVVPYDGDYFVNDFGPDFHLDPAFMNSPFEDLAVWEAGDPGRDYDGDPRPMADGTPDWAGFDVPQ